MSWQLHLKCADEGKAVQMEPRVVMQFKFDDESNENKASKSKASINVHRDRDREVATYNSAEADEATTTVEFDHQELFEFFKNIEKVYYICMYACVCVFFVFAPFCFVFT